MGFKLYGKELVGKVFVSKNNYPISIDIDNEGYDVTVGERVLVEEYYGDTKEYKLINLNLGTPLAYVIVNDEVLNYLLKDN